jgi:CRISPR-associated protein Cas2
VIAKPYTVVYDITEDPRRLKVAKTLQSYGERVQYSVFECLLTDDDLDNLQHDLDQRIDHATDSVRFYLTREAVLTLGKASRSFVDDDIVL